MNSTNLGRRGERGTQEGNGTQQTSQIRARETGPQGGGQPTETAPAGQPSAGRGGGRDWEDFKGRGEPRAQGEMGEPGEGSPRRVAGDRVGVPVERQDSLNWDFATGIMN